MTVAKYRDEISEFFVFVFKSAVGSDYILMTTTRGHLEVIRSLIFCEMKIFNGWIDQPDLQFSILYSISEALWEGHTTCNPLRKSPRS